MATDDGPAAPGTDSGSAYDSPGWFRREPSDEREFEAVREAFQAAGAPYLRSFWPWLCWAVLLPAAALLTPEVARRQSQVGVLLLWSITILIGGLVEATQMARHKAGGSLIARWALRVQGNLSLIATALSALLVISGLTWALPGLWLLLLGHSFYGLGGLSFKALRRYGLAYQLGGLAALVVASRGLEIFAATTALANAGLAVAAWNRKRLRGAASE